MTLERSFSLQSNLFPFTLQQLIMISLLLTTVWLKLLLPRMVMSLVPKSSELFSVLHLKYSAAFETNGHILPEMLLFASITLTVLCTFCWCLLICFPFQCWYSLVIWFTSLLHFLPVQFYSSLQLNYKLKYNWLPNLFLALITILNSKYLKQLQI